MQCSRQLFYLRLCLMREYDTLIMHFARHAHKVFGMVAYSLKVVYGVQYFCDTL